MNRDKHNLSQTADDDDDAKSRPNPIEKASFLSKCCFWWTKEIFQKGSKQYHESDIYQTRTHHKSTHIHKLFVKAWTDELGKPNPSMLRAICSVYGLKTILVGLLFSLQETANRLAQPMFLGGLVSYFAPGQLDISRNDAYWYASGIVLCPLVSVITFHPFIYYIMQVGMKIRIGCSGLIYSKALRLSKSVSNDGVGGKIVNLLSNDVSRFDIALAFLHDLWKGPLEALLLGYFIYREIGVAGIIGMAFLLSFIPLQAWVGKMAATYRMKTAKRTDTRVKFMNEIIQGIQVIKMYVWEISFAKMIENVRRKEVNAIRGSAYVRATLVSFFMISRLSIFLSLVTYVYFGNVITARKVFIVSSFYNILNESMVHFWPMAITCCAEGYISVKRIQEFMLIKEKASTPVSSVENGMKNGSHANGICLQNGISSHVKAYPAISMDGVTAEWSLEKDEKSTGLSAVTFKVTEPKLCVIIGTVGSGKSTFLNVVLKELPISAGQLTVNGKVSYAAQEAWLFNGSIKNNILFIEEYDERRYREVIRVCALEKDLQIWPHGDETIVGEKGVSLSGGQKARVNLARAIYRHADIYLLDDPLSAVDANVGKHIFDKCIREFLADKICILVTHQLQYLKHVPHIVLMQAGHIEAQGTYNELISTKAYMIQSLAASTESAEGEGDAKDKEIATAKNAGETEEKNFEKQEEEQEHQSTGTVNWSVYRTYFKAVNSYFYTAVIFLLFVLAQVAVSSVDYYVAQWVNWEESVAMVRSSNITETADSVNSTVTETSVDEHDAERQRYIYIYAILMGLFTYLIVHRTFAFFHLCLRISNNLHDQLFRGITRAKMYFFNTNPSGRIINRFSNDIGSIDTKLPGSLHDTIVFFLEMIAVVVIVGIVNYWFLLPTVVMSLVLFGLRKIYVTTSRSVKRIESLTRSPIFSHTNASLQGMSTIRAFDAQTVLLNEFHHYQNQNSSMWFVFLSVTRAFAFWLDMACVVYIAVVTYTFLVMDNDSLGGNVGLAIMQVMSLIGMCQWGMRQTAELENQMISVERVMEYTNVDPETPLHTEEKNKPTLEWPDQGKVEFNNVKLRYSEDGDYVLNDISFQINAKEKIGIVGRTGAGKSSLIQALFHLAPVEGDIIIDGVNTKSLGLYDIRKKISIIPQDPVLFSGTLRANLDPFEEMADLDLWNALELVELKEFVNSFTGGLNAKISDDGSNFSMGQRQLVCLARAILKKNKILVLDEATANVDPETDQLIQNTIKTQFADCTVFTIAHRLHTVIDNDRVMVMEAGRLVEFGHSHELLHKEGGVFRSLVEHTGGTATKLMELAETSFAKSKK